VLAPMPEIDPHGIGLVGHNEGGMIAPVVAVERGGVAFTVPLAGTALPGDESLLLQGEAIARAMGQDEEVIRDSPEIQPATFNVIREEEDPDVTLLELPGLNHLFQTAETRSPTEHASIDETFAPAALDAVSSWIVERFGQETSSRP